jgi:hypothetical protein
MNLNLKCESSFRFNTNQINYEYPLMVIFLKIMCFKLIFSIGLQTKNTGSLLFLNRLELCIPSRSFRSLIGLKYKYRVLSDKLIDEN